jgi:hypothetical protein
LRRVAFLLAAGLLTLGFWNQARAQSGVAVTEARAEYRFGEQITFTARIQSPSPIQEALILFEVEGEANTRLAPLTVGADGWASYQYPLSAGLLRPFARIFFWYRLTLAGGEVYTSPQFVFDYTDNRFPWQTLEDAAVRLHWYSGEAAFGQAALDAARLGLAAVNALIPAAPGGPVDVYIYASAAEVQEALSLGGQPWLAGSARPDLGVALVSIAPGAGQAIAMQRQIPHELAHVLLYRHTGAAYNQLPAWLREGIASLAELYPNADYVQVLGSAAVNRSLLPISALCGLFPPDASGALLAYAESASFTRYLHDTYGTSGLRALIQAYADGLDCEQGAARAFGRPLSQVDQEWQQQALGEAVGGLAWRNLLPYWAILLAILALPVWEWWAARRRSKT